MHTPPIPNLLARALAPRWPALRALMALYLVWAFQWTVVCHLHGKGHNVAAAFAGIVWVGTVGFGLQMAYYLWLALTAAALLRDDEPRAPAAPPGPALGFMVRSVGAVLYAVLRYALQVAALVGGCVALIAWVGYKGWWAFTGVLGAAALLYAWGEYQTRCVQAWLDAADQPR